MLDYACPRIHSLTIVVSTSSVPDFGSRQAAVGNMTGWLSKTVRQTNKTLFLTCNPWPQRSLSKILIRYVKSLQREASKTVSKYSSETFFKNSYSASSTVVTGPEFTVAQLLNVVGSSLAKWTELTKAFSSTQNGKAGLRRDDDDDGVCVFNPFRSRIWKRNISSDINDPGWRGY